MNVGNSLISIKKITLRVEQTTNYRRVRKPHKPPEAWGEDSDHFKPSCMDRPHLMLLETVRGSLLLSKEIEKEQEAVVNRKAESRGEGEEEFQVMKTSSQ